MKHLTRVIQFGAPFAQRGSGKIEITSDAPRYETPEL